MNAPIGVFDSGLGGLTVVRRLQEVLPDERIIYVADQTHVPYGGRDLTEVCGFACGISEALHRAGCKAIVMACNISSATALPVVQADFAPIPVLGVITPGAQAAAMRTRNGRIGILATEGTVKSGAYVRALHEIDPAFAVTQVACPEFVPLVETGQQCSLPARAASERYLYPLRQAGVDTIVLGCTHYPFLLSMLQEVWREVVYVDPADQTVQELAHLLRESHSAASSTSKATMGHLLTTTGDLNAFSAQFLRFLPDAAEVATTAQARWSEGRLLLP